MKQGSIKMIQSSNINITGIDKIETRIDKNFDTNLIFTWSEVNFFFSWGGGMAPALKSARLGVLKRTF